MFPGSRRLVAGALLSAALWAPGSYAQDVRVKEEVAKPAEQTAAEKTAAEAAEESRRRQEAAGQEVTYEQVLADPDNIDLNYRFARSQVRRGDVKGAAATLERILLIKPDLPMVRLFYGIVLYRLDDIVEAKRELSSVIASNPADEIRSEAETYLRLAEKREKLTHVLGGLSFAWGYDTNRNASPATGQSLFFDTPIQLTGSSERRSDTSVLFIGNVSAHRDLGTQAGHEVFAGFTYYQAEQTLVKTLNLKAYSFNAGGVWKAGRLDLTPTLLFDHVQLAQATLLRNRGGSLRADYRLDVKNGLFIEAKDVYQNYFPTQEVPIATERTGIQLDLSAGSRHFLNPTMLFGSVVGYTIKHAASRFDAFNRYVAGINHTWLLGRGTFLTSSFILNRDIYYALDSSISSSNRRDTLLRADATFGAPLSLAHKALDNLIGTVNYEYYQALSTIENYAFTDNKVNIMLTYRWDIAL